jgi:hypothetical protein
MSRRPALYPFGMKIASRAKQLQDRKAKAEEYGRNDAFSNRHPSYTFDLPLALLGRIDDSTKKTEDQRRTKRAASDPCGAFGGCALTLAKQEREEIAE